MKEKEKRQIHGTYQGAEKSVEQEGDGDASCCWCTWNDPKRLGKVTRKTGNQKKNRDHPDHSTVEIG